MTTIRNHVTLIGNIGSEKQVTNFENGSKVVRFSLATDSEYRSNSGKIKSQTQWHKVFAWGNIAQFIEAFGDRGKKVAIHGRLVTRTYLNADGIQRNVTEIEVKHILGL